MIYKKLFFIFLLSVLITATGCSKNRDIDGIYVHLKGEQRYYTLTIAHNKNRQYDVVLEGVPIDQMKKIPWTLQCTTTLNGNAMECETFKLNFNDKFDEARILYGPGTQQVFISNKIDIDEEVTHYENNK